ncbi:MAG TPA: hypothetical protein VNH21_12355 [Steroidobacteraceae bacterium]|nr:hypothetical protein [Steroidobacteraceae bacterium]
MSGLTTARLTPPLVAPLVDETTGAPSQAWLDHHTQIADQLAELRKSLGVADGSDAAAGHIGEYLTATASGVSLASGAAKDIATLALTAGDWDVSGCVLFSTGGGTIGYLAASVSASANALGPIRQELFATFTAGAVTRALGSGGVVRFSSASAMTAHLVGAAVFGTAMTGGGTINARRVR